jgi:hypothetical protein
LANGEALALRTTNPGSCVDDVPYVIFSGNQMLRLQNVKAASEKVMKRIGLSNVVSVRDEQ